MNTVWTGNNVQTAKTNKVCSEVHQMKCLGRQHVYFEAAHVCPTALLKLYDT